MTANVYDAITSMTSSYVNDLIKNHVIPKVVKYVNNLDRNVTSEELEQMLALQTIKTSTKQTNKKCAWIYKRGKDVGDRCNKPAIEGSEYCSYCAKRPCFKTKDELNVGSVNTPKSGAQSSQVTAVPYNKEKGLYVDEVTNYMYKMIDETPILIGKLDESVDRIVQLTNEEVYKATFDGMKIDEDYLQNN